MRALPAGPNRAEGHNQLGTHDDWQAVQQFLAEYQGQPATLRTYTKEVERLLLWASYVRRKALSALDRTDFAAYAAFMADPQPRALWCGPRRGRAGRRLGEGWRPFVGPLSPNAQRAALIILGALMNYLVRAGYLRQNPLALMRRQALVDPDAMLAVERVQARAFDAVQWRAIQAVLAPLPQGPKQAVGRTFGASGPAQGRPATWVSPDAREGLRERFLVAVLYFLALRVGELCSHNMGSFRRLQGRWYFAVLGKGHKPALVPVNDTLLVELQAFRAALQLPLWPHPEENTALVPQWGQLQRSLGERRVHQLLKALMARAASTLDEADAERAAHMRRGSAHWFRHTSLTRQAQAGISLVELRENARHSKVDTTLLYVHTERDVRHTGMQRHAWDFGAPSDG